MAFDKNKINDKLVSEKERLLKLEGRKSKLEEQIRKSEEKINEYENLLKCRNFDLLNDVIDAKNMTFEEFINVIQSGDLQSLSKNIS